jgi:hypothetical protein
MLIFRELLLFFFKAWGQRMAANRLKTQGLLVYLKILQAVRKSLLGIIAFLCFLQFIVLGLIGTFVVGVLLTHNEPETKLWILLSGFLVLLAVPMIGLTFMFSERLWFKMSGAEEFFNHSDSSANNPHTSANSNSDSKEPSSTESTH